MPPTIEPDEQTVQRYRAVESLSERLTTPCGHGHMVWRRWGSGPRTIVLQHGGHGTWSHWFRNIPALAERYTVLAADLPGCGESDNPPEPYDGHSLADIVVAGLDRLVDSSSPPMHLVGFSFGGVLGGPVAARLGQKLASLTLVGSAGLGLPRPERHGMKSWRRLTDNTEILSAHRQNLGVLMFANPSTIDDMSLYLQNRNTRACRLRSTNVSRTSILRDSLMDISAGLNGIWGERDIVVEGYLKNAEKLLRGMHPELAFEAIPDAGHWVAYEAADHFNATLLKMLSARET
jgi:2-hydroxy-6-oxonona-2,4-dienedioate hydrolase